MTITNSHIPAGATPATALSAHEQVVSAIQAALPEGGEVRLIGRVNDAAIGNASNQEVYFFIPDLHLVTDEVRKRYRFGFNHEESGLLVRILKKLTSLRMAWRDTGENNLVTVQLGDFVDLWREGTRDIAFEAHEEIRDLLYRGARLSPVKDYLNATVMLGNHDTWDGQPLDGLPVVLKAFNRTRGTDKPFLFVTHGDAFDMLEKTLPDWLQQFGVYYLAPTVSSTTRPISYWANIGERYNRSPEAMRDAIQSEVHDLTEHGAGSVTVRVGHEAALPDLLAQQITSHKNAQHDFFAPFYDSVGLVDSEAFSSGVRVAVIGHTHHARLVFCKPPEGERPLLLMDCGAWIEKCSYRFNGETVTEPNAQFGVIHGNDARIYQIHVKPV